VDLAAALHRWSVRTGRINRSRVSQAKSLPVYTARDNLTRFANLLYAGATVCLKRKREVFDHVLGGAGECHAEQRAV